MARYEDIRQYTRSGTYCVTLDWRRLAESIEHYVKDLLLDTDPPFQRGYVWTEEQKTQYVEYILHGGISGRALYTNCPGWHRGSLGNFVLVDGKQRLSAALEFFENKVPIFGGKYARDFEDYVRGAHFDFYVNDLETPAEVYAWYLALNAGGTVHTPKDLDKVRDMLAEERIRPTVYVAVEEPPPPPRIVQAPSLLPKPKSRTTRRRK